MPTQIGNSGMGMDVPSYSTMPPQIGNSGMGMAVPQPPAPGVLEMGGAVAPMGNQITPTGNTAYSAILQRLNDPNTSPIEYSYLMAQKQMMETGQYPVGY